MYRGGITLQVQELKKWLKQPGAQQLAVHCRFLDRKEDQDRAKKVPFKSILVKIFYV